MTEHEDAETITHKRHLELFAKPSRSGAEQMAAADDFREELSAVTPQFESKTLLWIWLANEARNVLEVDGVL